MTNKVTSIAQKGVDRVHNDTYQVLVDYNEFLQKGATTYRQTIKSREDKLAFTYTVSYITTALVLSIAKTYVLLSFIKEEIDKKKLSEAIKEIKKEELEIEEDLVYKQHKGLSHFLNKARELNRQADAMAEGDIYA